MVDVTKVMVMTTTMMVVVVVVVVRVFFKIKTERRIK